MPDSTRHLPVLMLAAAIAALPAPALAASSHCSLLPEEVQAETQEPDELTSAQLTPQGPVCAAGFELEKVSGANRCRRAGAVKTVQRNPQQDCYASLELGPVRSVAPLSRPAMQCADPTRIDHVVAIRGRNVGWDDITITAPKSASVVVKTLAAGKDVPAAEDPYARDCSPHDCRLLRLSLRGSTPPRFDLTLATPGGVNQTRVAIATEATCPAR